MLIRVGFDIAFYMPQPTALVLMLKLHPSVAPFIRKAENLQIEPHVPVTDYTDIYGNICSRVFVPAGQVVLRQEAIVENHGRPDQQAWDAQQHPVQELPDETLIYLMASRYCEVDSELKDVAWGLFGHIPKGWPLVQAISNFAHNHLRFDYQLARPTRTALEAYRERTGVCRDFTHLMITFCRCMNIPARYCTGYLGDFGIPPVPDPMDFSAWLEVYLGGAWHTFDPRNNVLRIGRLLMAQGRDAADVALTTSFGFHQLQRFNVISDEVFSTATV